MEKKLGVFDLVSIGIGSIIGAGIFSMLGYGVAYTGKSVGLALICAMLLIAFQSVKTIYMASMFSLSGGMYAQSAKILPPIFTGVSAAQTITGCMSFAVYGIALADYLAQLIPATAPYQRAIAVVILVVFFFIAAKGTGWIARVQNVMAVMMYLGLGLIVVFGFKHILSNGGFTAEPYFFNGRLGFFKAIAIMSYTCNGGSMIVNFANETKNPKKTIPLAYLITTLSAALIYFLIGTAASGGFPYEQIAGKNLGYIAQQVMPQMLYLFFIICGAMFALTTSLLGGVAACVNPVIYATKDGWLPKFLDNRRNVLLMIAAVTIGTAVTGMDLDTIVSFVLVPGAITGALSNILAIRIPKLFPQEWEESSMKVPFGVFVVLMLISIAANLYTAIFSMVGMSKLLVIGNLGMTIGLFVYSYLRIKAGKVNILNSTAD